MDSWCRTLNRPRRCACSPPGTDWTGCRPARRRTDRSRRNRRTSSPRNTSIPKGTRTCTARARPGRRRPRLLLHRCHGPRRPALHCPELPRWRPTGLAPWPPSSTLRPDPPMAAAPGPDVPPDVVPLSPAPDVGPSVLPSREGPALPHAASATNAAATITSGTGSEAAVTRSLPPTLHRRQKRFPAWSRTMSEEQGVWVLRVATDLEGAPRRGAEGGTERPGRDDGPVGVVPGKPQRVSTPSPAEVRADKGRCRRASTPIIPLP